ncbi:MAG: hypothetical protein IPP60_06005 [Sphingobacteriales bacterium]|nr:hypothetical protein [Sphingobacteriales bacterium]
MRDWIANPVDTRYIALEVWLSRIRFRIWLLVQSVISEEIKTIARKKTGKENPDFCGGLCWQRQQRCSAFYHF